MFKTNNEKLLSIINQRWRSKLCPMCGQNTWNIDDTMVTPLTVGENKDIHIGGKIIPLITITCMHCGNTVFVNPLVIDAVDTDALD